MASITEHAGRVSDIVGEPCDGSLVEQVGHAAQWDDHHQTRWQAIKQRPVNFLWTVYIVFAVIAISFDNMAGTIVIGIPQFRKDFGHPFAGDYVLDGKWQSAISGGPSAASILSSLIVGTMADRFGRKWTFMLGFFFGMIGVTLEFVATTIQLFFAGKFFVGFAIGFINVMAVTLATEFPPLALRGLMVGMLQIGVQIGSIVVVLVANTTGVYTTHWAYRSIFAAQWGFGGVAMLLCFFMPESPWWLAEQGKDEAVLKSLRRLGHSEVSAQNTLALQKVSIEAARVETKGASYLDCFRGVNLRRTMVSVIPLSSQAWCGLVFVQVYSTYYFQLAGLSTKQSFQLSIGALFSGMAGAIVSTSLYDRIGRRPLMLWGFAATGIFLFVQEDWVRRLRIGVPCVVAMIMLINFTSVASLGPPSIAVLGETATARLRAKTIAIGSNVQQASYTMWQFVLPYIFNPDQANLGAKSAFIFGGFCVFLFAYIYFCQTENMGRSFEELDEMFAKHVPARKFKTYVTRTQLAAAAAARAEEKHYDVPEHVEKLH